jgi:hypothetical protein
VLRILPKQSTYLVCVFACYLGAVGISPEAAAARQLNLSEPAIISSRVPKAARDCMVSPHFLHLNCTPLKLGIVQGGAELYDGVTTRYFVHHCKSCVESDPASRLFLGAKPSWKKMLTFGSIEAFATTYLHQRMYRSSNSFVRGLAPWLPAAIITVHVIEGSRNLTMLPSARNPRIRAIP